MLTSSGKSDWDRDKLERQLSRSVLEKLASVTAPKPQYGPDVPGWRWDDKRCFMLASTYKFLMQEGDSPRDSKCICHNGAEDIEHVLRKCPKAHELWSKVLCPKVLETFMTTPFDAWLIGNLQYRPHQELPDFDWGMRFSIYCWLLWKTRCCELLDLSYVMRESILDKCNQIFYRNKVNKVRSAKGEIFWNGHVRKRVEVEIDDREAACIVNRSSTLLANSTVVHVIRSLLQQYWLVQLRHAPREVNKAADKLVVMGRSQSREWRVFIVLPRMVAMIVDEEQRRWMEGQHLRTIASAVERSASHFGSTMPNV
ncbi:hypothetical protein V6N11_045872 [Hibiscus sabdariffa]|uniref:RNase H type-1 domain-containing protein n=1 Tax=Hibiscus sabdariffa TaxID=183260 RepID=A0ABR2Q2E8_9ROSI